MYAFVYCPDVIINNCMANCRESVEFFQTWYMSDQNRTKAWHEEMIETKLVYSTLREVSFYFDHFSLKAKHSVFAYSLSLIKLVIFAAVCNVFDHNSTKASVFNSDCKSLWYSYPVCLDLYFSICLIIVTFILSMP